MPKVERTYQPIFGSQGANDEFAVFGSMKSGTPVYSKTLKTLFESPAFLQGWQNAVAADKAPFLEEMNALFLALSQQIAYLFQQGMPEWDENTTYYKSSNCKYNGIWYESLTDENIGNNPEEDTTNWKGVSIEGGTGLPVGFIGQTIFPIDEAKRTQRYLNGSNLSINTNTQAFLNKLKEAAALYPSLLAESLEEWLTIKNMSAEGQCGKFFINEAEGYIRLPLVKKAQGCLNLANIGNIVDAGLPNITGTFEGGDQALNTDSFYDLGVTGSTIGGNASFLRKIGFEASRSDPVYGRYNTVQEEAIQYPYFIQIATGSETEVIVNNQLEILSGAVLFEPKFSSTPLYVIQYGAKDATKSKIDYPDAYNALLVEVNPDVAVGTTVNISDTFSYTKRGLSVKETGASDITEYDWSVNRTDETFTSPSKSKVYPDMPSDIYLYFCIATVGQNAAIANLGRVEEQLTNKVNITNTQWVTSAVIPDYTAGVSVSTAEGTKFVAPADGELCITYVLTTGRTKGFEIKIDNVLVYQGASFTGELYRTTTYIQIGKNSTLEVSDNKTDSSKIVFYPMKGAK